MIIDFTKFATPTRAINLADWTNIDDVDVDLAISKRLLVNPGAKAEYFLEDVKLEAIISPEYQFATHAAMLRATIRENDTLQIFHTLSYPRPRASVYEEAAALCEAWDLVAHVPIDPDDEDSDVKEVSGKEGLDFWIKTPPEEFLLFIAQSRAFPTPGVWFLRVRVSSLAPENESTVWLSTLSWFAKWFQSFRKQEVQDDLLLSVQVGFTDPFFDYKR